MAWYECPNKKTAALQEAQSSGNEGPQNHTQSPPKNANGAIEKCIPSRLYDILAVVFLGTEGSSWGPAEEIRRRGKTTTRRLKFHLFTGGDSDYRQGGRLVSDVRL